MSLFLEELLSEEDFKYNFNNKEVSLRKTLALFTLKKKNDKHWKKQGYAFNNPGKEHAEALVLKKIESYIPDQAKEKYEMTLYISWTPCHVCSAKIQSLAARNEISIKIYASRRYYFDSDEVQKGLYLLKKTGVSLKMMDETDYEKCQKLFVSPCKRFTSWPGLEDESRNNTRELHKLWEQEELKERTEKIKNRMVINTSNQDKMIDSCSISGAQDASDSLLNDHYQSPVTMERIQPSASETPQKSGCAEKTTATDRAVKRKLDFTED